jgi:ABC-type multidrug transport system permease subunit
MNVARIPRYIQHSVLSEVSHNRGRSWIVLAVDLGIYGIIFIIIIIIIIIIICFH